MDDRRFDALARALATPQPRRRLLQGVLGALLGAAAGGWESAAAKEDIDRECRRFCREAFPPGRKRRQCVSAARHGNGPCYECGPAAPDPHGPICRGTCCATDEECVDTGCCAPDPVETTCQGACGTVTNNCGQEIDCGSCGPQCVAPGNACASGIDCCGVANCNGGICCRPSALPCTSDAECCFGGCVNGFCGQFPTSHPAAECHAAEDCPAGQFCFVGDCAIGVDCPFDYSEEPGGCCEPPPFTILCDGLCVDPSLDPNNCRECGRVCPAGQTCDSRICCVPLGGACTTQNDCCGAISFPCIDGVCSHDCAPAGTECSDSFFCCGNSCVEGQCGCGSLHAPCLSNSDCCSGTCYQLFCA